jgi:hypothetical protein
MGDHGCDATSNAVAGGETEQSIATKHQGEPDGDNQSAERDQADATAPIWMSRVQIASHRAIGIRSRNAIVDR